MKKHIWLAAWALGVAGCSGIGLNTGDGTGGGGSTTTGSTTPAASAAGSATGVDCGRDPDTGATLCLGISSCPNLMIDSDAFPGCGFRVAGNVLDLECSCTGELCPIGTATTCADAQSLMQSQTITGVCTQVSEGRCTGGTASPDAAAAANTCNQNCYSSCASNPTCIQACGC